VPDGRPNVLLFSTPRSGSTWLMEIILTQTGFKPCDEPFDLRQDFVKQYLGPRGIHDWPDLYDEEHARTLEAYLKGIADGRLHLTDRFIHRNRFRLLTRRVVFKLLHAGEDRIARWRDLCRGRVLYLIRHPLPVSLSRRHLPRLTTFLNEGQYGRHFDAAQLREARRIAAAGDGLDKSVLDWCLQNALPLREREPDWILVTYEQLVLDPMPIIGRLCAELDLDQPARMKKQLRVASASTQQSDARTRDRLADGRRDGSENSWYLEKWRAKIDARQEQRLMQILSIFDIDIYRAGDVLPDRRFWME
jgi:hypothetical protein